MKDRNLRVATCQLLTTIGLVVAIVVLCSPSHAQNELEEECPHVDRIYLPSFYTFASEASRFETSQIRGVVSALNDGSLGTRVLAMQNLNVMLSSSEYKGRPNAHTKLLEQAIEPLVALLGNNVKEVRSGALLVLAQIGPDAKRAAKYLIAIATDKTEDSTLRSEAVDMLRYLKPDAKQVTTPLIALITDKTEDSALRWNVAYVLEHVEVDAKHAAKPLIAIINDKAEEAELRSSVAQALMRTNYVPGAAKAVVKIIKDKSEPIAVREGMIHALIKIGPDAIAFLVSILNGKVEDKNLRKSAVNALAQAGRGAIEPLAWIANDQNEDAGVRVSAVNALGQIGSRFDAAVGVVVDVIRKKSNGERVRLSAVNALVGIGLNATAALDSLVFVLADPKESQDMRRDAAHLLWKIGPDAKSALKTLVSIVANRNEDIELRLKSIQAVTAIEPGAVEGVLARAIMNENERTDAREQMVETLYHSVYQYSCENDKPLLDDTRALVDAFKDRQNSDAIRLHLIGTLGLVGKGSKREIRALISVMGNKGESKDVRASTLEALACMGLNEKLAIQSLIALVNKKTEDPYLREQAVRTLGYVGPGTKHAFKFLIRLLKHPDLKLSAVDALAQVGPDAVKPFLRMLNTKDESMRAAVLGALGKMGPDAKLATKTLIGHLNDGREDPDDSVMYTLNQVGFGKEDLFALLAQTHASVDEASLDTTRFMLHYHGAKYDKFAMLLDWLGKPRPRPLVLEHDEAVEALDAFRTYWSDIRQDNALYEEMQGQLEALIVGPHQNTQKQTVVFWSRRDLKLLEDLKGLLERDKKMNLVKIINGIVDNVKRP